MRSHRLRAAGARCLAAASLLFLLASCTQPFDPLGDELISLPWGVSMPRPRGVQMIFDRGTAYLLPEKEGWTFVLSVRRAAEGASGEGEVTPEVALRLIALAKRRAAALGGRTITRWRIEPIGLTPGLRFDYEGPRGSGQEAIPFLPGEQLVHFVAVASKNRRVYRLHLRSRTGSLSEAASAWALITSQVRFAGAPAARFPGSENVPEGTLSSLVREAVAGGREEAAARP